MSKFIGAGLAILLAATTAAAQDPKLYSTPSLPSREVLDRLNLRMAWSASVPMDGRRDGFASIQFNNGQVIAQTRSGVISAFDAETGKALWSVTAGKAYDTSFPPTFNSKSVLVVNGVHLAAIDRNTGALQWQHRMLIGVSAAPVADEYQIYITAASGRVAAFQLPSPGAVGAADPLGVGPGSVTNSTALKDSYRTEQRGAEVPLAEREVRPLPLWDTQTNRRLDYSPAMTRDALFYVTAKGDVFALGKYPLTGQAAEIYRFKLDRPLAVAPGYYDETAYIPTTDLQVFAISMTSGKMRWRYSAGAEVTRTPFTTDADMYVTVDRKGLVRLHRETGEPMWKLPYGKGTTDAVAEADRVIAVNNKFVYAADRTGRLLVLDRATGKQLSYYEPFRDFAFPVSNEVTDRLLLAANNGLLVCLHDQAYDKPLVYRKANFASKVGADRIKALQEKLARKVSEPVRDAELLGDVLEAFKKRYGVDILANDRPFRDAGLPPILDKKVTQPRVVDLEVGELLKGILTQVGATFEVVGDVVVVIPSKKTVVEGPKPPPPDMNPNPMQPPADAALREKLAIKVDTPANDKLPLGDMLTFFADRFDIKFEIDEKAFKAAGVEDVLRKEVVHPKAMKTPFARVLSDILAQVKGDYQVKGDTIVIVPKR
jgi:outer membrane protein assembly factor BamB